MTVADFTIELLRTLEDRLTEQNCSLSDLTVRNLNNLIRAGLGKMPEKELKSAEKRKEITASLLKVVNAMITDGKKRNLGGQLDNLSFLHACAQVKPLWPFL